MSQGVGLASCLPKTAWPPTLKTYRFVATTHHDVLAESLEEAVKTFNEMARTGLSPKLDRVIRVEVKGDKGEYVPVDRPLRAGDLETGKEAYGRPPV